MKLFDGINIAKERESVLAEKVKVLHSVGKNVSIGAVVFDEDPGSQLYTEHKLQLAKRVGITYSPLYLSMHASQDEVEATLQNLNADDSITGSIIQKPTRKSWTRVTGFSNTDYDQWWSHLVSQINPAKDIDGLSPVIQASFRTDEWQKRHFVLPATAKAVLIALSEAFSVGNQASGSAQECSSATLVERLAPLHLNKKICFIGTSELVCKPLHQLFSSKRIDSELLGRRQLEARVGEGKKLLDADVVITATGVSGLITGDMVKDGVILIDVGEPRPDVDRESAGDKPAFLTPVPGGIGPVTVVCLLENAVELVNCIQCVGHP